MEPSIQMENHILHCITFAVEYNALISFQLHSIAFKCTAHLSMWFNDTHKPILFFSLTLASQQIDIKRFIFCVRSTTVTTTTHRHNSYTPFVSFVRLTIGSVRVCCSIQCTAAVRWSEPMTHECARSLYSITSGQICSAARWEYSVSILCWFVLFCV